MQKNGAKFYVGLYSNNLIEKITGKQDVYRSKVSDQDRINILEALDFVDGAFVIEDLKKESIKCRLENKILKQKSEEREEIDLLKKYDIGYASGAFSNLHKGHIEHLQEMKKQCKTTIVAVNSDELIRKYKNKESSVDEKTRREILSHIKFVDMALITNDYDKIKALENVRKLCGNYFNAIFVGSDWKGNANWEEFERKLNNMGIEVVFTDRPKNGISTTDIDKSKKRKDSNKDR